MVAGSTWMVWMPCSLSLMVAALESIPPSMPPMAAPTPSEVPAVAASNPSPINAPAAAPEVVRMPYCLSTSVSNGSC